LDVLPVRGASRSGKNLATSGFRVMVQATTMAVCASRTVQCVRSMLTKVKSGSVLPLAWMRIARRTRETMQTLWSGREGVVSMRVEKRGNKRNEGDVQETDGEDADYDDFLAAGELEREDEGDGDEEDQ
jgi:hypothetical protein